MVVEIRILGPTDASVLQCVAPDVFDGPVDLRWSAEFLADRRHHLAVALDGDVVVGMASAVHYMHPDKLPELWINEVGVAPTHRAAGVGRRLLRALFARGRECGCRDAWVLTESSNLGARRFYARVGGQEDPEPTVMLTFRLDETVGQ